MKIVTMFFLFFYGVSIFPMKSGITQVSTQDMIDYPLLLQQFYNWLHIKDHVYHSKKLYDSELIQESIEIWMQRPTIPYAHHEIKSKKIDEGVGCITTFRKPAISKDDYMQLQLDEAFKVWGRVKLFLEEKNNVFLKELDQTLIHVSEKTMQKEVENLLYKNTLLWSFNGIKCNIVKKFSLFVSFYLNEYTC